MVSEDEALDSEENSSMNEDEDMEEGESDIEDDYGKVLKKGKPSESDDSEDTGKVVGKGEVYKAPKLNAVAFEDD